MTSWVMRAVQVMVFLALIALWQNADREARRAVSIARDLVETTDRCLVEHWGLLRSVLPSELLYGFRKEVEMVAVDPSRGE